MRCVARCKSMFDSNFNDILLWYIINFQCFWALGACFEVVLALAVAPTLGWRWLLGLSAAPLFVFAIITPVS